MLSCKEVAKRKMARERMGLREKLSYRMHLFICKACRVFDKQMDNLDKSFKDSVNKKSSPELEKNLKDEIIKKFSNDESE